jgi:hypothetical protein
VGKNKDPDSNPPPDRGPGRQERRGAPGSGLEKRSKPGDGAWRQRKTHGPSHGDKKQPPKK